MEVHHHPHLGHEPKKWKEYFLEFLMLFLAVTLGFFAENLREHIADAKKGKEYAIAYRDDLIKDTAIIEIIISIVNRDIASCDSLNKYLQNGRTKEVADVQKIYQYNLSSLAGFSVNLTDRTSLQLRNSGGLRLLTDKKVVSEILDYWNNGTILESMRAAIEIMREQAREKTYLIFDSQYYSENEDSHHQRMVSANARVLTDDYLLLAELRNRIVHFRNTLKGGLLPRLINQKKQATEIIGLIEPE